MKRTKTNTGILGTIITWHVPSVVSYDLLKQGLIDAGLDADLVRDLAPYHALCRALNDIRKGRVIRKLRREGQEIFFQLTREFLDEREITYEKESELSINADTGVIRCDQSSIKTEVTKLLREHQEKRMASDVTSLMFRIYRNYSGDLIAIRDQGGVYFVPKTHTHLVEQTRRLFNTIGGGLRSFDIRLGSEDTAESVAESMADYFEQLVKTFKESCEDIDASARSDVAERRVATVAELRRKLELYRGLLSGYASHIDDTIADANTELLRKLGQGEKT